MLSYFQTNETLEINRNLLSGEVRELLFSVHVVRREQWDNMLLGLSPLQYSALLALWQSHLDMITFKAFDLNLWMSQELDLCFITTSKK